MTENQVETPETNTEGTVADSLLTENSEQVSDQKSPEVPQTEEPSEKPAEPTGAPESYEFHSPDGANLATESPVIGAFSEAARQLDLTQEQAQSILDGVAPVLQRQTDGNIESIRAEWVSSVKSDPEIGGDKLGENLGHAVRVLDAYGTPELKSLLGETGLGDNPELIRFLVRAYNDIGEDRFLTGANSDKEQQFSARDFYNNSKMS